MCEIIFKIRRLLLYYGYVRCLLVDKKINLTVNYECAARYPQLSIWYLKKAYTSKLIANENYPSLSLMLSGITILRSEIDSILSVSWFLSSGKEIFV